MKTDQTPKADNPQKGKKKDRALTPKLRKLALLMPEVMDGKMTLKDAMLRAGYAESSALQQSQAVGSLRNNTRMQEALTKAGFTEDVIADNIVDGIKAQKTFVVDSQLETAPDYDARHKFLRTGAELLDAFPSKHIDATVTNLVGYNELDTAPKATSPEEARKLAEDNNG
jgi:hypothetical protein